jgi:putative Holliday junction resolvase
MSEQYNKTFLAFDYGERRIGVAKSDPTGLIASALLTLEAKSINDALEKIRSLIDEYEPDGLVFGYPLLQSGDRSKKCVDVDRFIEKLSKDISLPVYKVDEYDTSAEAEKIIHAHNKKVGDDKKRIDRLAAVLILQRFLDEHPK